MILASLQDASRARNTAHRDWLLSELVWSLVSMTHFSSAKVGEKVGKTKAGPAAGSTHGRLVQLTLSSTTSAAVICSPAQPPQQQFGHQCP